MANGEPGLFELLRQLSGPQWAQLVGTGLQSLGVGRPGQRIYPFGPLAAVGGAAAAQEERNRRKKLLAGMMSELPEPSQKMLGPLAESGELSTGDMLRLVMDAQQQQRGQRAAAALPGLLKPPATRAVPTDPDVLATQAEFGVGQPLTREMPATTLTQAEYFQRLMALSPEDRAAVMRLESGRGLPTSDVPPYQVFTTPHGVLPVDPRAVTLGRVIPGTEVGPKFDPVTGGLWTKQPGMEPTFKEVLTPQETKARELLAEFQQKIQQTREAATRQGVSPIPALQRLIDQYGPIVPKEHPVLREVEEIRKEEGRVAEHRRQEESRVAEHRRQEGREKVLAPKDALAALGRIRNTARAEVMLGARGPLGVNLDAFGKTPQERQKAVEELIAYRTWREATAQGLDKVVPLGPEPTLPAILRAPPAAEERPGMWDRLRNWITGRTPANDPLGFR